MRIDQNGQVGINTGGPRRGLLSNIQNGGPSLDVQGQVYGRLPVYITTEPFLSFDSDFVLNANTYFYITNSAFSTVSLARATSPLTEGGVFFQLKNATASFLSITVTGDLGIVSPVSIAPSNAITFVVSPSNANTYLLL